MMMAQSMGEIELAFKDTGNILRRLVFAIGRWATVGKVDFGDLGSLRPISKNWGFDRGQPVVRSYIEKFLSRHRSDVRGRALEVADNRFGGSGVEVATFWNVFAAVAFRHGLAVRDIDEGAREYSDPNFQGLITVGAVKIGPAP